MNGYFDWQVKIIGQIALKRLKSAPRQTQHQLHTNGHVFFGEGSTEFFIF